MARIRNRRRGLFITFEGNEGSGKSTQIQKAVNFLRRSGRRVLVLREPGGTRISEAIRDVLLNHRLKEMSPTTELLLYLAARAQVVREKIEPFLARGGVVVCDRYEDSTLAYQGYGRGFPIRFIREMSLCIRGTILPHRTFLLDIDPVKGLRRGGRHDRMEKQSLLFHRKVRNGFLALAKLEPKRFRVLDATQDIRFIAGQIREQLSHDLG